MVDIVPNVVFKTRVQDDDCTDCPNPYRWEDKSTDDFFSGRKLFCFLCLVHLHQLVQHINYQTLKLCIHSLKKKE